MRMMGWFGVQREWLVTSTESAVLRLTYLYLVESHQKYWISEQEKFLTIEIQFRPLVLVMLCVSQLLLLYLCTNILPVFIHVSPEYTFVSDKTSQVAIAIVSVTVAMICPAAVSQIAWTPLVANTDSLLYCHSHCTSLGSYFANSSSKFLCYLKPTFIFKYLKW